MVSVKKIFVLLLMASSQLMAEFTWSSPVTLSSSSMDNSSEAQVVMDVLGNATAIWVENSQVHASFLPLGGSWGTPAILSMSGASSPMLGCDGSGNVTAVWIESSGIVTSSTLPLGGNWTTATTLSASGASHPVIAVNASGNMAVVWARSGFIESSSLLFGGSWSLVSQISPANSSNPDVAIGANGKVVAVWSTVLVSGARTVESATQTVGGVWGSAINILPAPSAFSMNYPHVSVAPNGDTDVIWFRYLVAGDAYSNVFVYSAFLPSVGSSWSFPIQISDTGVVNPANLFASINTDGSGNKIAIWSTSREGSSFNLEIVLKPPGGAWSGFNEVVSRNLYTLNGQISTDSIGNTAVTYMEFDGTNVLVQAAETNTSGLLLLPSLVSIVSLSTGSDNGYSRVGASYDSSTGTAYATVVWLTSDGTNTTVQASSGSKLSVGPPTSVTVTQNVNDFGVFQDYYNTISWVASTDPNVIEYAVYRDGQLFAQVSAATIQIFDHNQVQNGSVTYGVAAVDGEFALSQIVNVNFP